MLQTETIHLMGTVITIQIQSKEAKQQMQEVLSLLERYRNRFSANDEDSELMAINQAAGRQAIQVHPELFELIQIGKNQSLASPSQLNIAIGPLVQTWRIGFEDAQIPSASHIHQCLQLTHPEDIILDARQLTVFLKKSGMKIDLGSLAKGYIADRIMDFLIADGITSALINLGGNVLVHGPHPNPHRQNWTAGIQNPIAKRGQHLGLVPLFNQSLVTSGVYERQLKTEHATYHHLLNPKTGYPIQTKMVSLSILAPTSLEAEIWSTRLFGLSPELALDTIAQYDGIEAIIVLDNNDIMLSDNLKRKFIQLPSKI